jgi:hypothetical protein
MADPTALIAQPLTGDESIEDGHWVNNCMRRGTVTRDGAGFPARGGENRCQRIRRMCTDWTSPNMAKYTINPEPP